MKRYLFVLVLALVAGCAGATEPQPCQEMDWSITYWPGNTKTVKMWWCPTGGTSTAHLGSAGVWSAVPR